MPFLRVQSLESSVSRINNRQTNDPTTNLLLLLETNYSTPDATITIIHTTSILPSNVFVDCVLFDTYNAAFFVLQAHCFSNIDNQVKDAH